MFLVVVVVGGDNRIAFTPPPPPTNALEQRAQRDHRLERAVLFRGREGQEGRQPCLVVVLYYVGCMLGVWMMDEDVYIYMCDYVDQCFGYLSHPSNWDPPNPFANTRHRTTSSPGATNSATRASACGMMDEPASRFAAASRGETRDTYIEYK